MTEESPSEMGERGGGLGVAGLCFLLSFYLWFEHLWSSVTATVSVLKLY